MFSARFMQAVEAKEMGIVNFIYEREVVEAKCIEYALNIAGNAPLTVKAAKAAVNAWERDSKPQEVAKVMALVDACFNSEDYKEGRKAFAAKRKPKFLNK
jgi:enoyl-CoA hydratase/carnithine racemase